MNKHTRKMIAPIIIAVCFILYFGLFFLIGALELWLDIGSDIPLLVKLLFAAIPTGFIGVMIFVLRERILEIKNGEEDDLSKY